MAKSLAYFIIPILLAIVQNVSAKSFIDDLETPAIIGIAVGALALLIVLMILIACCCGCCCFAKSQKDKRSSPGRDAQMQKGQQRQHDSWENPPQQQIPQQQYLQPSQNRPSSLESHRSSMPQQQPGTPQIHEQQNQQDMFSQKQSYQQDNGYLQQKQYPSNGIQQSDSFRQNYSSGPQSPQSQNYPQSPPPQNYPQSPQQQSYPSSSQPMFTASPPIQQQNHPTGQEYPIYKEQYQNTPMTSRVLSGFRYPDGLIEELQIDGSKKLRPPPPPKPIKLMSSVKTVPEDDNVPAPDY